MPASNDNLDVVFKPGPQFLHAFNQRQKPWLYHYAKMDGLRGIIFNRALWATHVYHLNDTSEFQLFTQATLSRIEKCFATASTVEQQFLSWLREVTNTVQQRVQVFTSSFSWKHDDRSQYELYGQYCLGFNAQVLGFMCGQSRKPQTGRQFLLFKCCYDQSLIRKVAEETVDHFFIEHIRKRIPMLAAQDYARYRETLAIRFAGAISRIAPAMKNRSFSDEREWRLVSKLDIASPSADVLYRSSNGAQVPYIEFGLKTYFDAQWKMPNPPKYRLRITIGPREPRNESEAQIRRIWDEAGLRQSDLIIRYSKIPLRVS